jgi:two-component system alkaline phosphatase synthesis response regulator PhoP
MLTARTQELDQVLGLELGADDYITKPFSPQVLVAHVRALLRRANNSEPEESSTIHRVHDLRVDVARHEVTRAGESIRLTAKEFDILALLASQPGRVFTRDQIINAVWDYEFPGETRIVDVHISKLRDKIEHDPSNPELIKTVRGVGYKLAN